MTLLVARRLLKEAPPGLSKPARQVLFHLGVMARPSGVLRWPVGDRQLVTETAYSLSSVRRGRRELVREGLLERRVVGSGPERSEYAFPQLMARAEHLAQEVAVGQSGPLAGGPVDHGGSSAGPPPVVTLNTPTRARTLLFQGSSSLTQEGKGPGQGDAAPLRGSEEHLASGSAAAASPCPTAASRGKRCASCRACGTNPRAQRAAAAADQRRSARGTGPVALTDPDQVARNQEGLAQARAVLAAREQSKAAADEGVPAPADPLSTDGGAP